MSESQKTRDRETIVYKPMKSKSRSKKDQEALRQEAKLRQRMLRSHMRDLFHELATVIRPPLDPSRENTKVILERAIEYIRNCNEILDDSSTKKCCDDSNTSPIPESQEQGKLCLNEDVCSSSSIEDFCKLEEFVYGTSFSDCSEFDQELEESKACDPQLEEQIANLPSTIYPSLSS